MNTLIVFFIVGRSLHEKSKQKPSNQGTLEQTLFVNIYARKTNIHVFEGQYLTWALVNVNCDTKKVKISNSQDR